MTVPAMELARDIGKALSDAAYFVTYHLTVAVTPFLQRDSFLYWPFIISTVAIAAFAWRLGFSNPADSPGRSWREFFAHYFGRRLWWHRSARADYVLYVANAVLLPLIFGYVLFGETRVVELIDTVLERPQAPDAAGRTEAGLPARLLFTVVFFVAYDFGRFVAHCLLHEIPLLWEFHKVHHSAEVLTPMTTFRAHPLDLLVMAWVPAITTGAATWLFHEATSGAITFYSFLGLHVIIWVANLIGNLRHSPVWLSYGPRWGRWLISPAHHQLHHSCEPRHFGCNRGFELAIWDRIYGTLYVPPMRPERFRMGLGDATDGQWNSLARLYLWPVAGAWRVVMRRSSRRES
jgi:sterol desaturase/sphingolipid hydroxylase (fatty acid hydroxylase superfamily)